MGYQITELGDSGLWINFNQAPCMATQARLWRLAEQLKREFGTQLEIIFGMNNLTLVYPPFDISDQLLRKKIQTFLNQHIDSSYQGATIQVPVHYGGDAGPDLEYVADYCQLSCSELIARHCATVYTVYFLGFQPGFAYMGGLASCLHTPRKDSPRLEVPAGSVGIGGMQTGIYPSKAPGGWQLIGRTELILFDPSQAQPSLFQPGDHVQFVSI